jgi:peptidoglycan/LPS O-acetylase OafA/YrhL
LDQPWAKLQGRISYSFYLWHDLVLIALGRIFLHFVPATAWKPWPLLFGAGLLLASVGLTAVLANACFRWVEKRCIDIARQLSGKITGEALRSISREAGYPESVLLETRTQRQRKGTNPLAQP